jgi:hypothetical protein
MLNCSDILLHAFYSGKEHEMIVHQNDDEDTDYKKILHLLDLMPWASKEQISTRVRGNPGRSGVAERLLIQLANEKKIRWVKIGKKYFYTRIRRGKFPHNDIFEIEHAVACTEGFLRFYFSDTNCTIIPESWFFKKGYYVAPEWGLVYPNQKVLLFEFCTRDNVRRLNILESKVTHYSRFLKENHRVLFVMDVPLEKVTGTMEKLKSRTQASKGHFFFIDYEAFLNVPFGEQLSASIYLYEDGCRYALGDSHVQRLNVSIPGV